MATEIIENVPNLDDGLSASELYAFWQKHQRGWNYQELFPAGGKRTKSATRDLANYAINKSTAMKLRESGNIARAKEYEDICDRIYNGLPDFARW